MRVAATTSMRNLRGALGGVAAGLLAACGTGESSGGDVRLGALAEPNLNEATITTSPFDFTPCSLVTGGNDNRAECATVEVPLDWERPDGSRISLFVKRLRGGAVPAKKQLWLLQGGPGGAGDGLEPLADAIVKGDTDVDVYIPDHRGTGRSTYLDCTTQRTRMSFDMSGCLDELQMKWGTEGLASFNTTTAARDLGFAVQNTREKSQEVHVYGVSYGTYWAQRYLQLFPKQATAVTLDSACQSGLCSFLKIPYWYDRVGKKYLSACAADAVCASKLGLDPVAKVRDAIARANARTCPGLRKLDGEALRQIYGWLIASFDLRVLIPSTTYRILRCDADDVLALQRFETAILTNVGPSGFGPSGTPTLSSEVLGYNIAFSELEEDPPVSRADLAALLRDAVFTTPDPGIRALYDAWPKYQRNAWVGAYPAAGVPLLLMNGTLDPQTPQEFAETIAPHYTAEHQTFVLLPRAAHGVVRQSPIATTDATPTCGMSLWRAFLASPTTAMDASCRASILPLDFGGSTAVADFFFGRPTLWGPALSAPTGAPAPAPAPELANPAIAAELQRVVREVRPWLRPIVLGAR